MFERFLNFSLPDVDGVCRILRRPPKMRRVGLATRSEICVSPKEAEITNSLNDGPVNELNGLLVVFDLPLVRILCRPSDLGSWFFIEIEDDVGGRELNV